MTPPTPADLDLSTILDWLSMLGVGGIAFLQVLVQRAVGPQMKALEGRIEALEARVGGVEKAIETISGESRQIRDAVQAISTSVRELANEGILLKRQVESLSNEDEERSRAVARMDRNLAVLQARLEGKGLLDVRTTH